MIKKVKFFAAVLVLFAVAGAAIAGGDPKAGQSKSELCQGCHGADGMSVNPECPNLAGQKAGYIIKQVIDFQKGLRHNDTMTAMAGLAGDMQDLKDIAAYFSTRKPMAAKNYMMPAPSNKKSIKKGKKIFMEGNPRNGLYACVNCHGPKGKGKSATNHVFPVIGGQTKDYLAKQLRDFKSGDRKNDPANMMVDIAKKLSEKEIDAVSDYLGSLN